MACARPSDLEHRAGISVEHRANAGERALGLPREPSFDTNKPFSDVLKAARNWDSKAG